MLTALVLQLIQCVVVLPEQFQDQLNASNKAKEEPKTKQQGQQSKDNDSKKETAVNVSYALLSFLFCDTYALLMSLLSLKKTIILITNSLLIAG